MKPLLAISSILLLLTSCAYRMRYEDTYSEYGYPYAPYYSYPYPSSPYYVYPWFAEEEVVVVNKHPHHEERHEIHSPEFHNRFDNRPSSHKMFDRGVHRR